MAGGGGNVGNVQPVQTTINPNPSAPMGMSALAPAANRSLTNATSGNTYQQAAGNTNLAAMGTMAAGAMSPANVNSYMNPYTQNVVDTSLGDLNRMRQMSINDVGAQATSAGAFGGSRHGLLEAETNRAAMDQAGQLGAQLRNQGYMNAQNMALADAQNKLAASGQLAGIGQQQFGMGQDITNQQMAQGLMQQGLQQSLIDAAKAQYSGYANAPANALAMRSAATSSQPYSQVNTTTKTPGLFDFLSLGLSMFDPIKLPFG